MPNFSVMNTTGSGGGAVVKTPIASYQTAIITFNSTTPSGSVTALRRGRLYDMLIGTAGTPADFSYEWDVARITGGVTTSTLGSLSSVSSNLALDTADNGGAGVQIAINSSVETDRTVGVECWYVGVNQRASYRWVAAPGSEIVWPANASATATNGLAGRVRSASGGSAVPTMQWMWLE